MAGKSWQPGHDASHRKWEQAPVTLNKHGKREGRGGGNCLDKELPLLTTLQVHAQSTRSKYMQECLQQRSHGIPVHAHM